MLICLSKISAQHLSSARSVAVGGISSGSVGLGSLDWNPAGISSLKNWELSLSNYANTSNQNSTGMIFNSLIVGKKIFDYHFLAIQYSPGKQLNFVVPSSFSIFDSAGNEITAKFDKEISYRQKYSFGYAYSIKNNLSIGVGARFYDVNISDYRYTIDNANIISSYTEEFTSQLWSIDLGLNTSPLKDWTLGLTIKNLFQFVERELNEDYENYRLKLSKLLRLGLRYSGYDNLKFNLESNSKYYFQTGVEYQAATWLNLCGGIYNYKFKNIDAISAGVGIEYAPVRFDISYLKYLNNTDRKNIIDINRFKAESFIDIDYTPFSTDKILLTATFSLAAPREALARIEYVEMLGEIFTSAPQVYAFRPIGRARVKNISDKTIYAKVSFFVEDIMNTPTETRGFSVSPDEVIEIPFYAVFNELISQIKKFSVYDGTVFVSAETPDDYEDKYQTRLLVRSKNDWDGDVLSLRNFVTPNDPEVIKFSRETLINFKTLIDTTESIKKDFIKSKLIFAEWAKQMVFVNDPKASKDYVQYPAETLTLHGGDCDDLTVSYGSLLMSMGIAVAFIDVVPPEHPENSHVYLMFDSGIEPSFGRAIAENSKKYVIRKNEKGKETIWIPIETTLVSKDFDEAWNLGAKEFYEDSEIRMGISRGWLRVIDLPIGF
ncbi:MAG: conjugal transfer protein TraF [Ignavibacteriales bacterium]|nr:conjugal transfer protein TraF [Ignavibacteriales bacterium]